MSRFGPLKDILVTDARWHMGTKQRLQTNFAQYRMTFKSQEKTLSTPFALPSSSPGHSHRNSLPLPLPLPPPQPAARLTLYLAFSLGDTL